MPFMPFQILGIWFRGVLALALLGGGIYLVREWFVHPTAPEIVTEQVDDREEKRSARAGDPGKDSAKVTPPAAEHAQRVRVRHVDRQFGLNRETACLLGGLLLICTTIGGRFVGPSLWRRAGDKEPSSTIRGEMQRLRRPDGTELQVEIYGPADGPPVVLTHGWGLDREEWCYLKQELGGRFRLITWDLPGLGNSSSPLNKDWSLEKLAHDLDAVLNLAGSQPAVLLGHSIGGMITLTFCRLFPKALEYRVCGLVLAQTTYTNPVKTASLAGVYTALQKPILEPMCHLMIWLAPLFWLLNWMSFWNGSAHRSTERGAFSGRETRGQLNFMTRYIPRDWPGVLARGYLAMFRYDASATLGSISIPTLIVSGDRDALCTPEAGVEMNRAIPNSKLFVLNSARHCGLFEHHEQFATAVGNHLAACQAGMSAVKRG